MELDWGLSALKADGTFLNDLLESSRNFIEIYGNKGFAFVDFIASRYARRTGEGSAQAADPSPEGPSAEEHKPQLTTASGQDMHCTASRGPGASAETCEKPASRVFRPSAAIKTRIYTTRGRVVNHGCAPSRTVTDSEIPCRPSDESENRPGGSHIVWVQPEQTFDRIVRTARNP